MQIALKFRNMLPEIVRQELDSLVAMISGFFSVEHNPDGTHGAITCSGITVGGAGLGTWIPVPYDPLTFSAVTGTWTVLQANCAYLYTLIGKTCLVHVAIAPSTTSAGTASVRIALPVPMAQGQQQCIYSNQTGGAFGAGLAVITPNLVSLYATPTGAVGIPAGTVHVYLDFAYQTA